MKGWAAGLALLIIGIALMATYNANSGWALWFDHLWGH